MGVEHFAWQEALLPHRSKVGWFMGHSENLSLSLSPLLPLNVHLP